MPRLTRIDTPPNSCLIFKDVCAFQCNPVSAERAISRIVFYWHSRIKLLELFDKSSAGINLEIRQLFQGSVNGQLLNVISSDGWFFDREMRRYLFCDTVRAYFSR